MNWYVRAGICFINSCCFSTVCRCNRGFSIQHVINYYWASKNRSEKCLLLKCSREKCDLSQSFLPTVFKLHHVSPKNEFMKDYGIFTGDLYLWKWKFLAALQKNKLSKNRNNPSMLHVARQKCRCYRTLRHGNNSWTSLPILIQIFICNELTKLILGKSYTLEEVTSRILLWGFILGAIMFVWSFPLSTEPIFASTGTIWWGQSETLLQCL